MKITPHQMNLFARETGYLYNSLTGEIIRILIDYLNTGHESILEWHTDALKNLHLFNKDVAKQLAKITGLAEQEVYSMFEEAGKSAIIDVDSSMPYEAKPIPTDFDNILNAYANQCWRDIDNYVNQTLVSTNYGYGSGATKEYTRVLNRVQNLFNTGLYTRTEALEKAVQELAYRGIKSTFVDKGGHTWSLERYVQTVLDSTLANTYNELRTSRMAEYGVHTVVVTAHVGARPACSIIQGQVVDLRENVPEDSKYKSIYDPYWQADYGEPGGHRGCNCKHMHIPFIPGVNTNNQPVIDKKINDEVASLMKKQRNLERQIVKLKKNQMISERLGEKKGAKTWGTSIRRAQKRMRELVDSNEYLSRDYTRERVYTPIETLLEEHFRRIAENK